MRRIRNIWLVSHKSKKLTMYAFDHYTSTRSIGGSQSTPHTSGQGKHEHNIKPLKEEQDKTREKFGKTN